MRPFLLLVLMISLCMGCASTPVVTIGGETAAYGDSAEEYAGYPYYCATFPDLCQDYPDGYGYYPDGLWYLDYYPPYLYYPYYSYYPSYPYYRYHYWLEEREDDHCLLVRDYWKQVKRRIEYRREARHRARERRIAAINRVREYRQELRRERINRIRRGLERIRPRNILRSLPGRWRRR